MNNTALTNDDESLVLQVFATGDIITLKTKKSSQELVPIITALIIHCTNDMLSREEILPNQDPMSNFILGAYLIATRTYQDAVAEKTTDKPQKGITFL